MTWPTSLSGRKRASERSPIRLWVIAAELHGARLDADGVLEAAMTTDDPNDSDYWTHKAANTRYSARALRNEKARVLLGEIADRYDAIGEVVASDGPLTKTRVDRLGA
jgi:hypothetical protein